MPRIFKPLTRDQEFCAPSGEKLREVFTLGVDHDGCPCLVHESNINIQDYVNSFHDECLIENIVRRFENGDLSALNRVQGTYFDSTILPGNIHEASKVLSYAKKTYSSFYENLRKDFPTFDSFIDSFASPANIDNFIKRIIPDVPGTKVNNDGGDLIEST